MAATTPSPRPAGSHRRQALGLEAFTLEGRASIEPTQKPRGQEWTPEQQDGKRARSRRRVRMEQVKSRVKRGRLLKETIRRWPAGLRDLVMAIGCGLQNFRVRLTPSWAPMV
jgi:hypothetical protein